MRHFILIIIAFCGGSAALAQTWTPAGAPTNGWVAVTMSADGNTLYAVKSSPIYSSTNAGITWNTNALPAHVFFKSIGCSADGTRLIAAAGGGLIFISTNSARDWIQAPVPATNSITGADNHWACTAISADGTRLVAAAFLALGPGDYVPGSIYTSADSGMTWQQTSAPITNWMSVASSADGSKLAAVALDDYYNPHSGLVCLSTNGGTTWFQSGPPGVAWASIASSADGDKLVAGSEATYTPDVPAAVYTSTDSGITWVSNSPPAEYTFGTWQSVAISADGTKLVAVKQAGQAGGGVDTSADSGNTWISNAVPNVEWWAVASAADGNRLVAATSEGGLYTLQATPAPAIKAQVMSTNGLQLSWLVPSTNFVLQQNSNLATATWSAAANAPVLNLTNLQNEVTLPLPAGNAFYRLKTP